MSSDEPDPAEAVSKALSMRASDADREKVAATLRHAYADGRLSLDDHPERLSEVYRATTYAELIPVPRDLPVPPGTIAVPQEPGRRFERKGAWSVSAEMRATCVFGGLEIKVPEGIEVQAEGLAAVFGGIDVKRV